MRSPKKILNYNIPKLWHTSIAIVKSLFCKKHRIAVCCIAKNENLYIREWVEYHKGIGVDSITIYDNNDTDGEHFDSVIEDYIQSGFCRIIDFRGKKKCQFEAYDNFYSQYGDEYDWIAFIDCDEFLTFGTEAKGNIKNILSSPRYLPFQMIHINWMCYGDCDQLDYENRNVIERFPNPIQPLDFKWHLSVPENDHVKTIVRGGLKTVYWIHPHYCCTPYYYCCNNKGEIIEMESPFSTHDFTFIYLRHYRTKSIGEYTKKIKRGYPDQSYEEAMAKLNLDDFFAVNTKSTEKETYAKELLKKQ